MKIVRASAGSGKTYTLAKTYIDLLMASTDRYAYRHILAVTFTNKATEEMKSRILRNLSEMAQTDQRARDILTDILHDYSAFSISTIDRFFQQTLKAFSREIGQFSSYQVELDRDSLIRESMVRILDGLTEDDKDLVSWLKQSVMDRVEQGQRFSIDDGLYEIGKRLKSEEMRKLLESHGIDRDAQFTKERLIRIRKSCRKVMKDFCDRLQKAASDAAPALTKAKAIQMMQPYVQGFRPGDTIQQPKVTLSKECQGSFFLDCFGEPYREYCTACQLDRLIFSLGLAGEFYKEFDALLKEKSVMPLDDSNTILRDIIDGSDAPFVYEKMGIRFENFLLDEFQDTSTIQWENFLPLLRESESHTSGNLVVGDVKQSIYRWRSSDWRLLGSEVGRQFPDAEVVNLQQNWRSVAQVVNFNNGFFRFAAERLGASAIYSDVKQEVKSRDPQQGSVRVSFVKDEMQMGTVVSSILDARSRGTLWGDVAVLVRNRKDGAAIASELIASDIPVISDDSLALKSSVVIRRLCSLLSYFDNSGNSVGSFLASSMEIAYPTSYHSLVDLCEGLLRSLKEYDPDSFEGETLFIQAFMDDLQSWVDINGNNLMLYLKHWDESDPYIGSPENADSVRILTIHKSKGLEFPFVIFPFADKVGLFKDDVHWCHLDASGSALGETVSGVYPVTISTSSEDTLFSADYHREKEMQAVDNLNVFYVALTRAVKELHVISKEPTNKFCESLDKGAPAYGRLTDILYEFGSKSHEYTLGEPYDYSRMEREAKGLEMDFPASYPSIPIADRLKASDDAMDYFGEDGHVGIEASSRLNGIALHGILSCVQKPEDLRKAVDECVRSGSLSAAQGQDAYKLLSDRIAAHPQWFVDVKGMNELTVFGSDGSENRPDRVVLDGSKVIVIDYKFGEHKNSYQRQVARYCSLYRRMGYADVSGYIWYVPEDAVVEV